jgi:hypothetical protein
MNTLARCMIWIGLAVRAAAAPVEEITFFQASAAGPDAWSWAGARVIDSGGKLLISEQNKDGDYGDAFVADAFAYYPSGRLVLDVDSVREGVYTLQILCFKGKEMFHSVDAIKGSRKPGRHPIELSTLSLPPETGSVMFKIWVAESEGAAVRLNDLVYTVPIIPEKVGFDARFTDPAKWAGDQARLTRSGTIGRLELTGTATFGSILNTARRPNNPDDRILLQVQPVAGSTVTLQLVAFDAEGMHLGSVDAIKDVGAGWHGARLGSLAWPDGATQFEFKIWLGGKAGATADLMRLLILKP